MSNAAMQAFINELGSKIFYIYFNGGAKLFIGIDAGNPETVPTYDEIQFKTFGDTDMFGVTRYPTSGGKVVPYTAWFVTSYVQAIGVTVEELQSGDPLPDITQIC